MEQFKDESILQFICSHYQKGSYQLFLSWNGKCQKVSINDDNYAQPPTFQERMTLKNNTMCQILLHFNRVDL